MNLIIIGTDHTLQDSCESLKELIARLAESEQITLIGEEFPFGKSSVAQRVAQSKGIKWIQIDMTTEARIKAGIFEKLSNRMQIGGYDKHGMPILALRYAPNEDGVREEFWLDRIAEQQVEGTALIVCGALHVRKVSERAQRRGHVTKLLFLPEIPGSQFWVSIEPDLF